MQTSSDDKALLRESLRLWLREAIRISGLSATEIARRAKLSPSTLTRPLKGEIDTVLTLDTIHKVARVTGVSPPDGAPGPTTAAFREQEAVPYIGANPRISAAEGSNSADWWRLQTKALDIEGYIPGDLVLVDLNETAMRGDVVIAQVYDASGDVKETVFRIFEPPYLLAHSMSEPPARPLLVDNTSVVIMGVVVSSWRPHRRKAS